MRQMMFRYVAPLFVIPALAAAACSGNNGSPAAPSSIAGMPAVPTAGGSLTGATISGAVLGGTSTQSVSRAKGAGLTVSVAGTAVSSPVDASGRFVLQGVPSGNVQLQFTGNGVQATLTITGITDHAQIAITVVLNGSTAEVDDKDSETPDSKAELEGRITAISGHTLTVAGKTVTVTSATTIAHGGTTVAFAALKVGDRVHVHGTVSGSTVTAVSIELQTSNPGNPGPPVPPPSNPTPPGGDDPGKNESVEASGKVAGLSGACPSIQFTLGTTTVTTSPSTKFSDGTCSQIATGTLVEVKGTKQANGSIAATSVSLEQEESHEPSEASGKVAGLSGTCPTIQFTLGTTTVTTSSSTQFSGGTCSQITAGTEVEVKGAKQTNGSIAASSVKIEKSDN